MNRNLNKQEWEQIDIIKKIKKKKDFDKNVVIGITYAPRGGYNFLDKSIKSIRNTGIKTEINVFSEPDSPNCVDDVNTIFFCNEKKLGAFKNFHHTLKTLLKKAKEQNKKYIWITQDDYYYHPQMKDVVEQNLSGDFGFLTMTTRSAQQGMFKDFEKIGFYDIDGSWGTQGVSYIIPVDVVEEILHDDYYNYHLNEYEYNCHIDACIGYILSKMGKSMYYYNPSLSIHIGIKSTLNHPMRYAGYAFFRTDVPVIASLATIPEREENMKRVVEDISPQVDRLYIALNGYEQVPSFLKKFKNVFPRITDNSIGDAEKFKSFFFINKEFVGYYFFTVDDDLLYPEDYVEYMIDSLNYYNNEVVVGFHGIKIMKDFKHYKEPYSRRVWKFDRKVNERRSVHILGTGVLGFFSNCIDLKDEFNEKNMADILFAIQCKEKGVRRILLPREGGYIKEQEVEKSIWKNRSSDDSKQTELVRKYLVPKND